MKKTYNIQHSISLLKTGNKIYKPELYQVASKTVHWNKEIQDLEKKKYAETIKYLDRELLGK